MRVIVTGGTGFLGGYVIKELQADNNIEVFNIDARPLANFRWGGTYTANLEDLGETMALLGVIKPDAIIHLAAIPNPLLTAENITFRVNVMTTYNIFYAASVMGVKKVVFASTDSSYGMVFAKRPFKPQYLPVDENHPQLPQDPYGGSKLFCEEIAKMFIRGYGIQAIGLRITSLERPEAYRSYPEQFKTIPYDRLPGLFNYLDVRDAASAFHLALYVDNPEFKAVIVTADETVLDIPSMDVIRECFPEIKSAHIEGYGSLYSNSTAKKLLGWEPKIHWRDEVKKG